MDNKDRQIQNLTIKSYRGGVPRHSHPPQVHQRSPGQPYGPETVPFHPQQPHRQKRVLPAGNNFKAQI